jgi:hypothetical protein
MHKPENETFDMRVFGRIRLHQTEPPGGPGTLFCSYSGIFFSLPVGDMLHFILFSVDLFPTI